LIDQKEITKEKAEKRTINHHVLSVLNSLQPT